MRKKEREREGEILKKKGLPVLKESKATEG